MKLIKLAIISLVLLFLLITVFSLFIPSTISLSKTKNINATKEKVLQQLNNPQAWKNWFPGMDSMRVMFVDGKPKGVVLNEVSKSFLSITEQNDTAVIAEYVGIHKSVTTGWNILQGAAVDSVSLQWFMKFKLRWYPWEKFAGLLFEKQYGTQMEIGLEKLSALLENPNQSRN